MNLTHLTAVQLRHGYLARQFSPTEVIDAVAGLIDSTNPQINALTTPTIERAARQARAAASRYLKGESTAPLDGIPIVVKDLFDTAGIRTTYGSEIFTGHVPDRDAVAVGNVTSAGAILVGKSATHEFGLGITTDSPHFGPTRNPWVPDRVAGGSSGGSGAALAAGYAPLALGSDTGGSIRIPAAFCGVAGLKPTHARIDPAGVFPLAPSLDHVGPMARTPQDLAILFAAMTGQPAGRSSPPAALSDLRGVRVGRSQDLDYTPMEDDLRDPVDAMIRQARELGADIVDIRLPAAVNALEALGTILGAEAYAVHRRAGLLQAREDEYAPDARARLQLGAGVSLDDYLDASAIRQRLRAGFSRAFEDVDLIMSPVAGDSPLLLATDRSPSNPARQAFRATVMPYIAAQSLAGLPACVLRAGFDRHGAPVGIQLTAPAMSELRLLRYASVLYEATTDIQEPWPG